MGRKVACPLLAPISEMALERRNRRLLAQRKESASELAEVIERMKELPAKANKLELLQERDVRWSNFRKKVFMDMVRATAHNARRMALRVSDKYCHNYRDRWAFDFMLLLTPHLSRTRQPLV